MPNLSGNILIVEARFYEDIADALVCGAETSLEKADQMIERVAVPGVFEIPTAIKFAWDDIRFDGCVTLGCVIRGETDHYDHICREVSRALMDLSIKLKIPHGFGIIHAKILNRPGRELILSRKILAHEQLTRASE